MLFDNDKAGRLDFTQNFINIDNLCDAMSIAQEQMGLEPTFELKDVYKVHHEEKKVVKKEETKEKKPCGKGCGLFDVLMGHYSDGEDDDEDDFYLCELCSALSGYEKKYDASICDSCDQCEYCDQYINEECSGCSYSTFRDGEYYRDKVDASEIIGSEDLDVLTEASSGDISKDRLPVKRFSVLR